MDNLKKLLPEKLLKLWNAGKVSVVEATGYLMHKLIELQQKIAELQQKQVKLEQSYLALNLTVYQLKADVDSLKKRSATDNEEDSSAKN